MKNEQIQDIFILTAYSQRPPKNAHADVSSKNSGLDLDLSLHLYIYIRSVY